MSPNPPNEVARNEKEGRGRGGGQPRWNYKKSRDTKISKIRSDLWQSKTAMELGLNPRSFEELHTERSYLVEMLQQHDRQALELFKRLAPVAEQVEEGNEDEQKRAKKHQGWLKNRIAETVKEEKSILMRLSELHVEIQCRDRWSQVERDREMRRMPPNSPSDYGTPPLPILPLPPQPYVQWPTLPPLYGPQYPCGWNIMHYHDAYAPYPGPEFGFYPAPQNTQGHNSPKENRTPSGGEPRKSPRKHSVSAETTSDREPKPNGKRMSLP
ncbi:hypothetical protein F5B20DRAFT_411659 [Whalleya microplaca]|nr:hypothetical protein F5B20DRAFT_411659 [Whalleya microplaca]